MPNARKHSTETDPETTTDEASHDVFEIEAADAGPAPEVPEALADYMEDISAGKHKRLLRRLANPGFLRTAVEHHESLAAAIVASATEPDEATFRATDHAFLDGENTDEDLAEMSRYYLSTNTREILEAGMGLDGTALNAALARVEWLKSQMGGATAKPAKAPSKKKPPGKTRS